MKTYYCAMAAFGAYDEYDKVVIYVGEDAGHAIRTAKEFQFPDSDNNSSWVDTWEDGFKVKTTDIIE